MDLPFYSCVEIHDQYFYVVILTWCFDNPDDTVTSFNVTHCNMTKSMCPLCAATCHLIPDLVPLYCYNNLQYFGKTFHYILEHGIESQGHYTALRAVCRPLDFDHAVSSWPVLCTVTDMFRPLSSTEESQHTEIFSLGVFIYLFLWFR